jgi:hypothetical protein
MKPETTTPSSINRDIELFDEASRAAEEIYKPLGFLLERTGVFYNPDLEIRLLPFHERECDESPASYALRSAFKAGRCAGQQDARTRPRVTY